MCEAVFRQTGAIDGEQGAIRKSVKRFFRQSARPRQELEQYPAKWGTDLLLATDGRSNRMASSPQHEPTMEEILASIRKIISEDSSEAHAAPVIEEKPAPHQCPPLRRWQMRTCSN